MEVDPLQLPLMSGRVAVAVAALSHSLFATFIVGGTLIGAAVATAAFVTRREAYLRLAHMIAFTVVLTTATVSFLGVTLVFTLNVFWPRFWHTIFRIMFWPFILEAVLFLGEAVCAYSWYYLWSWASAVDRRRALHLALAWGAAGCALAAMIVIDITASYMLTPHPPDRAWANLLNPTMIHLDVHRWFGNLTWAGFGLAALCALAWRRSTDAGDRAHYRWAAGLCFAVGFGAVLVMPVIGYQYLLSVRYAQPQAFHVLMLGPRAWLFDLVAFFYGLLVLLGSVWIFFVVRSRAPESSPSRVFLSVSLAVLTVATLLAAQPYHLQHTPLVSALTEQPINPLGKMQPYKYIALAFCVVFGFVNWTLLLRWFPWKGVEAPGSDAGWGRRQADLLLVMALTTVALLLTMGWVRETARASDGHLIYDYISFSDEEATYGTSGAEAGP